MKKNRQRTLLGIVLATALSVLVIDRISQSPESAVADDTVEDGVMEREADAISGAAASVNADPSAGLAEESANKAISILLDRFADRTPMDQTDLADAFAPSARWSPPERDPVKPGDETVRAREFVASNRLTAIIRGGEEGRVMLNDSIVRIGQSIDGYTLISVGSDSAVFEGGEDRIELTVAEAGVRIMRDIGIMRITTPAPHGKTDTGDGS